MSAPPTDKQLRAFHAVAETGSVTDAARRLGITQPAVTVQVRTLERERGVRLFDRGSGGLTPTEAGEALHRITRRLFRLYQDAADALQGAAELTFGTLRIGADGPFAAIPVLARFVDRYPGVRIEARMGNAPETLAALSDSRVDVAVLSLDGAKRPALHIRPLHDQGLRIVMPRDHPWAGLNVIRPSDLDGVTMVGREQGSATRDALDRVCAAADVRPAVRLSLGSREAVREAVVAGLGLAAVLDGEAGSDPRLVDRPLDARPSVRLVVACLSERRDHPPVRAFLELAEKP
ncbi:LysR substrate-binding domain-containing protein [Thalassobaculum sp.]|uniref:LysR substrate-binding domain-containing protein n=1 Tax=Thalassobaculum sp. TaxID=2022740 RepID=UPI0032F0722E